jgi:hypothetical protein
MLDIAHHLHYNKRGGVVMVSTLVRIVLDIIYTIFGPPVHTMDGISDLLYSFFNFFANLFN